MRRPGITLLPLVEILRCPLCLGRLEERDAGLLCRDGGEQYPVTDGIPQLFVDHERGSGEADVTRTVKAFYEETPFPNYDDLDNRESLTRKARAGVFARLVDEQLPPDGLVLEVGCGTGQLTNFLGMNWRRRVIGADMCMNSLRLGKGFRDRFGIVNADFVQMNLFRPPFADGSADVVISSGVMHHTGDPYAGFRAMVAKLKPGGYVLLGLYNWLGRLPTLWRRWLIELVGDRAAVLDRRLRGHALGAGRSAAWFRDQYRHPHESRHSVGEVLRWFGETGVEFVSSIPAPGDVEFAGDEQLFQPQRAGSRLDRLSTELEMLLSGGQDGGLFVVIGRKRT